MGTPRPRTVVLDAGALIALEKRSRKMEALLRQAQIHHAELLIPAGVLAQVWSGRPVQAPLSMLLNRATTKVVSLDRVLAEAVGRLLRQCRASDVVDASVVVVARTASAVVVTSDPDDLRALDPSLELAIL